MSSAKQVSDSTGVWHSAKVLDEKIDGYFVSFDNFTKKHDGFYAKGLHR